MRFDFATSARILFGSGTSSQLKDVAREYGRRALVVTGRDIARVTPLVSALDAAGMEPLVFSIAGEPTIEMVRNGARLAREQQRDVVIGLGGGSPMDAAKAIAAVATNSGEPLDYLEVVGKGHSLQTAPLPFIAVPTTAGPGAEVTRNAVLGSPEHRVKASLRSPAELRSPGLRRSCGPGTREHLVSELLHRFSVDICTVTPSRGLESSLRVH